MRAGIISQSVTGYFYGFFIVVLPTLWDFRVSDIRIFDAFSFTFIAMTAVYLYTRESNKNQPHRINNYILALGAVITVYALLGFARYGHRSSIGMTLGLFILMATLFIIESNTIRLSIAKFCTLTHIALFATQVAAFFILDKTIDFHAFYGVSSRLYAADQFRGSGLFQEPNSLGLALFMISIVLIVTRSKPYLIIISAVTMALTQSLWAIGASLLTLALWSYYDSKSVHTFVQKTITSSIFVIFVLIAYIYAVKPVAYQHPALYYRISNISTDGSMTERYVRNNLAQELGAPPLRAPPPARFDVPNHIQQLLGNGFSTHYFLDKLPANGFSLVYRSFGILGSIALLALTIGAVSHLPRKRAVLGLASILFTLTNYPLFTYAWFWIWLAFLFAPQAYSDKITEKTSLPHQPA